MLSIILATMKQRHRCAGRTNAKSAGPIAGSGEGVRIPVQAVGGLTLEQAIQCPAYGAPLVVLGAPLTIDADAFKTAEGDLESSLRLICEKIHALWEKYNLRQTISYYHIKYFKLNKIIMKSAAVVNYAPEKGSVEIREIEVQSLEKKMCCWK